MQIRNPKTGDVIKSELDDEQAAERCSQIDNDFPRDLAKQWLDTGKWSSAQRYWAHRLANEKKDGVQLAQGAFIAFKTLFDNAAASELKWPKIRIVTDYGTVRFYWHQEGFIMVRCGDFPVGKIDSDDIFTPFKNCEERTLALVKVVATDPIAAAMLWGKQMGKCCFCMQELTDERSVNMGYGPICAERWGLPWG